MRVAAFAIVIIATIWTAAPARAQTYDPKYPVCLELYGEDGSVIECGFTSLAQCTQAASGGRSAMCFNNPYFANAAAPAVPRPEAPVRSPPRR
ncbi:DUF3551 domain-containing protein [Bradyrhizobium sp.]|uniref:DUF3551 domain-containing protein n=1 Tax=Bradyrhizobium sp. TaxID=376 RepID=UPI00272376B1|nr:DUF3551 domain-containing protein [Bradyrhizobium sp.]MDO9297636.1 DUF3551 domain-containing protein [Bradyrhizobium sp.]